MFWIVLFAIGLGALWFAVWLITTWRRLSFRGEFFKTFGIYPNDTYDAVKALVYQKLLDLQEEVERAQTEENLAMAKLAPTAIDIVALNDTYKSLKANRQEAYKKMQSTKLLAQRVLGFEAYKSVSSLLKQGRLGMI